jgi:hypothetical protein
MTDGHGGYVVVLEQDIREDDAEAIINALKQIKGVLSVQAIVGGSTLGETIATTRVNTEWQDKLAELVRTMWRT